MNEPQHLSEAQPLTDGRLPLGRQLGSGAKGLARLSEETRGLVEDVKEWVELRIELTQLEIQEQIEERLNQILLAGVMAVIGLFIAIFVLITAAVGLGWWLGHSFWGFLIVTGLLVLVGGGIYVLRPQLAGMLRAEEKEESQNKSQSNPRLPE